MKLSLCLEQSNLRTPQKSRLDDPLLRDMKRAYPQGYLNFDPFSAELFPIIAFAGVSVSLFFDTSKMVNLSNQPE
ncbi:hypothetical protein TNIN_438931 [Trichonephila inaurata madagascariensis]|uniref:Uncharacterized protein n=1 Tax=Trichonephila inaurata madagascariensis TaxID=2747483 RepID=A0A8X7CCT8_9ARAC|nr:hypothetical protein TNIN_438931 [Trichonephila inaurata madagascariensis]